MSFASLEISRRKGLPATLYLLIYGTGNEGDVPAPLHYAYTDAEQPITYNGITYEPVPVERDAISSTGNLDKLTLTLRLPRDIGFAEEFRVYPPSHVTTLIIRQGHLSESPPEFLVCWSGRVLSVGREGDYCIISGEPIASSMRRPGLRRHYQIGCPHVLYSVGVGMCNANKAAATYAATVAAVSATVVTLVPGWSGMWATTKFTEGMLEWTNPDGQVVVRKILGVSGDTLQLSGIIRDLTVGSAVLAVLGCNHRKDWSDLGDCFIVHNNIMNYGGCDWIPVENPIGFNNQFY